MSDSRLYSLNPWISIWTRPKETMRFILDHYPHRLVHTLTFLGAFTHVAGAPGLVWDSFFISLLTLIFTAIIAGVLTLYIEGFLLRWTGTWLKGQAYLREIMAVIAWSQIPAICLFFLQMIVLIIVKGDALNLFYTTLRMIFLVWTFIIFLCCLAEAQKFSFWKALFNFALSIIILLLAVVVISFFSSLLIL